MSLKVVDGLEPLSFAGVVGVCTAVGVLQPGLAVGAGGAGTGVPFTAAGMKSNKLRPLACTSVWGDSLAASRIALIGAFMGVTYGLTGGLTTAAFSCAATGTAGCGDNTVRPDGVMLDILGVSSAAGGDETATLLCFHGLPADPAVDGVATARLAFAAGGAALSRSNSSREMPFTRFPFFPDAIPFTSPSTDARTVPGTQLSVDAFDAVAALCVGCALSVAATEGLLGVRVGWAASLSTGVCSLCSRSVLSLSVAFSSRYSHRTSICSSWDSSTHNAVLRSSFSFCSRVATAGVPPIPTSLYRMRLLARAVGMGTILRIPELLLQFVDRGDLLLCGLYLPPYFVSRRFLSLLATYTTQLSLKTGSEIT
jgi:hypothetical protein